MPIHFSRRLTGSTRSPDSNRQLGFVLAFVAGAINAGGFLAVQQYTSHMTGVVSSMADQLALGQWELAVAGLGTLLAFIAGAATSAVLVNFSRQHELHARFALPLMLEASLLLCFGLVAARFATDGGQFIAFTVMLLAYMMGLQNAVITKLSNAEIRTTHITGIVTDLGIELGKLVYRNPDACPPELRVQASPARLALLALLTLFFFGGGIVGALGFKHMGYRSTVPLALVLLALASVPIADDLARWLRRPR